MPPPSDRQRQQGFDAFRRGDFGAARRLLAPSAMAGEAEAGLLAAESAFRLGEGGAARFFVDKMVSAGGGEDAHLAAAGVVLIKMGDTQTAERLLMQAAASHPEWIGVRVELTALYLTAGRVAEASSMLVELESAGAEIDLLERLRADTLRAGGDVEGARELYRRCLERTPPPGEARLAELEAFLCNLSSRVSSRESFEAHARFGRALEHGVARLPGVKAQGPERRLRIGFVCDNFAAHSVAHFLTAPLKHLDRADFEAWAYSTNALEDGTTGVLCDMCDRFVRVPGIAGHDLAARVRADKVDVLVDLNGLTQGHRLGAFALKPAPLSVTWLAYPSTTGLSAIDLRIVDSVTDPEGDSLATERLVRIDPCFICFTPLYDEDAERVARGPLPARERDHVVLGCFNNAVKITDSALGAWSRVLSAVPGSRLVIKGRGLSGGGARAALSGRLARAGIDPARFSVLPETATVAQHLAAYGAIDIQLDTFPYNGTTTTCESLMMGVPVVTVRGDRHSARVGASLLTAAGLPELIGQDEAGYVRAAVELAGDRERLAALRGTLRERLLASPLCDAPAFAERMGGAIRAAWRALCAAG